MEDANGSEFFRVEIKFRRSEHTSRCWCLLGVINSQNRFPSIMRRAQLTPSAATYSTVRGVTWTLRLSQGQKKRRQPEKCVLYVVHILRMAVLDFWYCLRPRCDAAHESQSYGRKKTATYFTRRLMRTDAAFGAEKMARTRKLNAINKIEWTMQVCVSNINAFALRI